MSSHGGQIPLVLGGTSHPFNQFSLCSHINVEVDVVLQHTRSSAGKRNPDVVFPSDVPTYAGETIQELVVLYVSL